MKSTAFATNSLDALPRKTKDALKNYAHLRFSTICGKTGGKAKNPWCRRIFSSVDKFSVFQQTPGRKNNFASFIYIFCFSFFSFALQGSTAFSDFHISLHIFSFSTGHLFKKIHNHFALASFPQNQNLFPHLFPSEKSRKRKDEKPCGICVFGTFPTFLQTLSPLLLKNS